MHTIPQMLNKLQRYYNKCLEAKVFDEDSIIECPAEILEMDVRKELRAMLATLGESLSEPRPMPEKLNLKYRYLVPQDLKKTTAFHDDLIK